jgi:protease-4
LVDQLGNFEDAVDLAKRLAGIKGEITLVYPKKTRGRIWDLLLKDATKVLYESLRDILNTRVEYRWDGLLQWRGD